MANRKKKKKKKVNHICKNCGIWVAGACGVVVLQKGERYEVQTQAEDRCIWETRFTPKEMKEIDIQQVRFWVENPETGEPTKKDGRVKMEYPAGFFGDPEIQPSN